MEPVRDTPGVTVDPGFPERVATALAELFGPGAPTPGRNRHLMLAGGSGGEALARLLARSPTRERIDWAHLELWLGDERAVAPDHPDSNWGMVQRTLLAPLAAAGLGPAAVHPLTATGADLVGQAAAYAERLRLRLPADPAGTPQLDLLLLGLGRDGHTASLFPGSPALAERARLVVANPVASLGTTRLTITWPLIGAARRIWFVVAGGDKGPRLRQLLAEGVARGDGEGAALPAGQVVRLAREQRAELRWWLDGAAGAAASRA